MDVVPVFFVDQWSKCIAGLIVSRPNVEAHQQRTLLSVSCATEDRMLPRPVEAAWDFHCRETFGPAREAVFRREPSIQVRKAPVRERSERKGHHDRQNDEEAPTARHRATFVRASRSFPSWISARIVVMTSGCSAA